MSNFKIRFANKKDCSTIFNFIKAIAEYEKMADEVIGDQDQLYQSLFINRDAEVIIGEEDGEPVGFALFFHNYSTFLTRKGLYLEDLFVYEDKRKLGYGKKLFLKVVEIAKERDCQRMEWVCLNWNAQSIDFYKKMGAVALTQWSTYRLDKQALAKL